VASLYALLQLHGERMCASAAGCAAIATAADAMLAMLRVRHLLQHGHFVQT